MSKVPPPSPALNRLRAAAGLIPLISSGLADGKLSMDRAALMCEFCSWAADQNAQTGPESERLTSEIKGGLEKLKARLA